MEETSTKNLRTWIEIDTDAIDKNLAHVRALLPESTKIMAVVKSNAYGHGLFDLASYLATHPSGAVSWIGVDSITEAVALRKNGITLPMLVMGYTLADCFSQALEYDISLTISNMTSLLEVISFSSSTTEKIKIQIKIDTGLHRQGFLPKEIGPLLEMLTAHKNILNIEGIYTHLADAKRIEGIDYSENQKKVFDGVRGQFAQAGFADILSHISASPAVMRFGKEWFDGVGAENDGGEKSAVRLGAILYGIYPSDTMQKEFQENFPLYPALTWKAIISELKEIPAGETVGYNRSETLSRDTLVGICPVGYWHGYPGSLSSKGVVLVSCGTGPEAKTYPAKILGRVSMDMITIDCTDCIDVKVGDEVALIDSTEGSEASAQKVAENAGVSVHELLTRLNPKIKRIFRHDHNETIS